MEMRPTSMLAVMDNTVVITVVISKTSGLYVVSNKTSQKVTGILI